MKKALFTLLVAITSFASIAQNVGIGTTTPNASAQLEVSSTNSGFLPPRMTYAQRNAIVNPAAGLIVYCTDCNSGSGEMNYFNGSTWMNMTIGTASNIVANLPSVTICNQIWTTKNLDVSTYRNGDAIAKVTDAATWASLTTGAYCYYNNDSTTFAATYGKLYNWYAVNDPRGLAPEGWHVPTYFEWELLLGCLGGGSTSQFDPSLASIAMRETGNAHWIPYNSIATNSSGFTAVPGGYLAGDFYSIGEKSYWWCSNTDFGWWGPYFLLLDNTDYTVFSDWYPTTGFSVRCLRD